MATFNPTEEFTFADVLLLPGKSRIEIAEESIIDLSTNLTKGIKLEIPIISANMPGVTESDMAIAMSKMGGLGIIHQFMDNRRQLEEVRKVKKHNLFVGAAVYSYGDDIIKQAKALIKAGCDLIVVDSANAHNERAINLVKELKRRIGCELIVGNIVSGEAALALIKAGADGIKVGIGPGSHCTTRIVTGHGRPQLSAIKECAQVAKKYGIPVIADGGIGFSGDIVKALALGASAVMLGGLLAATDQAPGKIIKKKGLYYKKTLGNCTEEAALLSKQKETLIFRMKGLLKRFIYAKDQTLSHREFFIEEGVGRLVEYKGDVRRIVGQLVGEVRRGLWYGGATSISELQKKAKFIRVSAASLQENEARI